MQLKRPDIQMAPLLTNEENTEIYNPKGISVKYFIGWTIAGLCSQSGNNRT
jgi:hypothetical protein